MKLTKWKLAKVRRALLQHQEWYRCNHRLAFKDVEAFYFASGAAAVLNCFGKSAIELGRELVDPEMQRVFESLPESTRLLVLKLWSEPLNRRQASTNLRQLSRDAARPI